MRRLLLTLALAVPAALSAQNPDLRGNWVLDLGRSDLGQMGQALAASGMTVNISRTVSQTDSSVTFTQKVDFGGQVQSEEATLITSGQPKTETQPGGETATTTASWKDGSLTVTVVAKTQMGDITANEVWTLSADGKTLTIAGVAQTPMGEVKTTQVFGKKDA
jgi:hypothetical protein